MVLNKNIKAFVIYITFLNLSLILIHLARKTQIASLIIKKIIILNKYSDFANIFLKFFF